MTNTVTGWLKAKKDKDKQVTKIANLVETKWLMMYPWPKPITFYQG